MKFESVEITDDVFSNLPGKRIKLEDGHVYYELDGPEDGEVVVLVHGFSVPQYCWDPNFKVLVQAGFRVLRYDLYGRGYSDRPEIKYSPDLFDRQLLELLSKLDLLETKINVVGLSMGGLITINFADKHPRLVKKIALFDPAGFPLDKPPFPGILKVPVLGKFIFKKIGNKTLIERSPTNLYKGVDNPLYPDYKEKFIEQMKYRGFLQAILSTMLNTSLSESLPVYKRLGGSDLPIQLFWGEFDEVLAQPSEDVIKEVLPKVEFHLITDSGHTSNFEQPQQVNPLLITFLKK
jgi:pimeloyl-ACP methyl ester carboxylesterase